MDYNQVRTTIDCGLRLIAAYNHESMVADKAHTYKYGIVTKVFESYIPVVLDFLAFPIHCHQWFV